MPTIECKKAVEVVNPKAHSTFGNPKHKPSTFLGQPTPKPQPVHFPHNYPPPDNPPQDVANVRSIQNSLLRMNTFQLQYSVAKSFLFVLSLKIVPCTLYQLFNYEIMDYSTSNDLGPWLCSCGTKPQHSENHHFVMTSSWEPQCHHDIIMRTPRITGKPKFSCSGGL